MGPQRHRPGSLSLRNLRSVHGNLGHPDGSFRSSDGPFCSRSRSPASTGHCDFRTRLATLPHFPRKVETHSPPTHLSRSGRPLLPGSKAVAPVWVTVVPGAVGPCFPASWSGSSGPTPASLRQQRPESWVVA